MSFTREIPTRVWDLGVSGRDAVIRFRGFPYCYPTCLSTGRRDTISDRVAVMDLARARGPCICIGGRVSPFFLSRQLLSRLGAAVDSRLSGTQSAGDQPAAFLHFCRACQSSTCLTDAPPRDRTNPPTFPKSLIDPY